MSNYDHEVRFEQGADDGEMTDASIQPVSDNEVDTQSVLRRPTENVRERLEIVRGILRELLFRADYDRATLFDSWGTFTLTRHSGTPTRYSIQATNNLRITPFLAPGMLAGRMVTIGGSSFSGARLFVGANAYAGTLGVNDLHVYADTSKTGQRGYRDGVDMNDLTVLSVGANDITFELTPDPGLAGSAIVIDPVEGMPTRHIHVRYGNAVTLLGLINAINGDKVGGLTQSQGGGTWGIAEMVAVGTTVLAPGGVTLTGGNEITIPKTILQGGYDSELHIVTPTQLSTFFTDVDNRLEDGEGIALAYPAGPVEPGGFGGCRQSLTLCPEDRVGGTRNNTGSTAPGSGHLFNTGRHPELVPGSVPIGRMFDSQFYFADGSQLETSAADDMPGASYALGDPVSLIYRLRAITSPNPGASLVGMDAGPNWCALDAPVVTNLAASSLNAYLDALITQLANTSADTSGARALGGEAVTGSSSDGNTARQLDLAAGSIRAQLEQLLNKTSGTDILGINGRVAESGHRLNTANPLEKYLGATGTPTTGVQMLRGRLTTAGYMTDRTDFATPERMNPLNVVLLPFSYDGSGGEIFHEEENVQSVFLDQVVLTDPTVAGFEYLVRMLPMITSHLATYGSGPASMLPSVFVQISGLTQNTALDGDGFYLVERAVAASRAFYLRRLDGATNANFSGATVVPGTTKLSVFTSVSIGAARAGELVQIVTPPTPYGAVAVYVTSAASGGSGAPVHTDSPWLTTYTPNPVGTTLDSAYIGSRLYGRSARWYPSSTVIRDTENILVLRDKQLLDGIETSAPVDASLSHHHDGRYTEYVYDPERSTAGGTSLFATGFCWTYHDGPPAHANDEGGPEILVSNLNGVAESFPKTVFWEVPDLFQQDLSAKIVDTLEVEVLVKLVSTGGAAGMKRQWINLKVRTFMFGTFSGVWDATPIDTVPLSNYEGFYAGLAYYDGATPIEQWVTHRFSINVGDLDVGPPTDIKKVAVAVKLDTFAGDTDATQSIIGVRFIGVHRRSDL